MKKLLIITACLIALTSQAQTNIVAKLAFNPIGDDFNVILQLDPATNTIKTRQLPGMTTPLLYTDSVVQQNGQWSGHIRIVNWTCKFRGYQSADSIQLVLVSSINGAVLGQLAGSSRNQIGYRMQDMAKEMVAMTKQYIYDTLLVHTPEWKTYEKNLLQTSAFLQDDLEFFALANRDMNKLTFTHYAVSKMSEPTWNAYFKNTYETETPASLTAVDDRTALLTINSFGGNGKSLERFMQEVISKGYTNLIIDLRQNSGGGAGAVLALGKYLGKEPVVAGALLTNKWFLRHQRIPTAADYPNFAVFSEGSTNDLIAMFAREEGIILKAKPANQVFTGKLHILTSARTASACEPFVYGMKYFKRATIIGERTAGAMLSKIPFAMSNGFKLYLPVTDYYTIDGVRLDKNGVEPNIATSAANALNESKAILQNN